jgi:hypothetical protein
MRSPAGLYFGRDDPLPTMRFPSHIGPVEIAIDTFRVQLPGFTKPVRRGLVADVRGEATSSKDAVEAYANFTRGVAAVLSVAANAPVGHFTADIVFENTPGKREREYYRRSFPADPGVPSPGRRLEAGHALGLFTGWMRMRPAKRLERWNRAAVQYQLALLEWEPGAEIPATNYLWVGMEALTPIALEQHLKSESITRDELLERWSIQLKDLDPEVRRRLLFQGDDECYSTAREVRNQALHGYEPTWKVREGALEARNATATYLREALIRSAGLKAEDEAALLDSPYDRPFHWTYLVQMYGRIISDDDNGARPEDLYPRVDWEPVEIELPPDAEGDAGVALSFNIVPHLADGASFEIDGVQVLLPNVGEFAASFIGPPDPSGTPSSPIASSAVNRSTTDS